MSYLKRRVIYQSVALVAATTAGVSNTRAYQQPLNPEVFSRPFPVADQQYVAFGRPIPRPVDVEGFFGVQLDYKFAKPFPAAAQQWNSFQVLGTPPFAPIPWQFYPHPPHVFAKPFPIGEQPFTTAPEPKPFPPPNGWAELQYSYRFAKPFPVTEQVFSVWDLYGDVPVVRPPGAGKRPHVPPGAPLPPYDVKPAKTFQPVWDRRKEDERRAAEKAAIPPAPPPGPPPLPPASLFGAPMGQQQPTAMPTGLPTFDHLVPPDPMGLAQRMKEAQDMSDAIAVLKALGLNLGG